MALIYNGTITTFKKVSGYNPGPLKPTVNTVSGDKTTITNYLQAQIQDAINNLADRENIQVVVSANNEVT